MALRLLPLAALADGEVRVVRVEGRPPPHRSLIVARSGEVVRVYWNVCRHLPVPLDSGLGEVSLDDEGHWICQTHGALYRPEDGRCVRGPCEGQSLDSVDASVVDGMIVVDVGAVG